MTRTPSERPTVYRSATLSPCARYRYSLQRHWDGGTGRVVFIMLNPSTADGEQDDNTIRKCIGYARLWNHASLEVVNLYAWRATKPAHMFDAARAGENIVGQENDARIIDAVQGRHGTEPAARVIAAWGVPKSHDVAMRAWAVHDLLVGATIERSIECLLTTNGGWPRHPLYPKADLYPRPWFIGEVTR